MYTKGVKKAVIFDLKVRKTQKYAKYDKKGN
jgi:hypothetical protein